MSFLSKWATCLISPDLSTVLVVSINELLGLLGVRLEHLGANCFLGYRFRHYV